MTKRKYIEGTTLQLDLWGDQIESMDRHVARWSRMSRTRARTRLAGLRRRKRAIKRRLREAVDATGAEWEGLRRGLESEVREFCTRAAQVYDTVHGG